MMYRTLTIAKGGMVGQYFNCGASISGRRVKTKKELKELLKEDPSVVYFDGTALFTEVSGYQGDEIPEGTTLAVVGPDPFRSRKWYASGTKSGNKVRVS